MTIQRIDCRFLIGLPGSGKTTYRKQFLIDHTDYVIISTDDVIDSFALQNKLTYNEAFDQVDLKAIEIQAQVDLISAVSEYRPIIIDRVNMSKRSRNLFANLLSDDYKKTAVVFNVNERVLHERWLDRKEKGKIIPLSVLTSMRESYAKPRLDEFHEIIVM